MSYDSKAVRIKKEIKVAAAMMPTKELRNFVIRQYVSIAQSQAFSRSTRNKKAAE
jgi:hypothetical protein